MSFNSILTLYTESISHKVLGDTPSDLSDMKCIFVSSEWITKPLDKYVDVTDLLIIYKNDIERLANSPRTRRKNNLVVASQILYLLM